MSELIYCGYCTHTFGYDENLRFRCHDCDSIIETNDDGDCELCGGHDISAICPNCTNSDYTENKS